MDLNIEIAGHLMQLIDKVDKLNLRITHLEEVVLNICIEMERYDELLEKNKEK